MNIPPIFSHLIWVENSLVEILQFLVYTFFHRKFKDDFDIIHLVKLDPLVFQQVYTQDFSFLLESLDIFQLRNDDTTLRSL